MSKKIKVIIDTRFIPYSSEVELKPRTLIWKVKNAGRTEIDLNNVYRLFPFDEFGIDNTHFIEPVLSGLLEGKKNKIEFRNNTKLSISFGKVNTRSSTFADLKQLILIETSFQINKQ